MKAIPRAIVRFLGPAWVLLGGAFLLAVFLRPTGERMLIEGGLISVIAAYELALPLFGLGLVLSQCGVWQRRLGSLIFCVGIALGLLAEHRVLVEGSAWSADTRHVALIGPLCCLTTAVALALPGRIRPVAASLAALIAGLALGFFIGTHDPSIGDHQFSIAASAAGLWLVSIVPAILERFSGRWLPIGGRIFASWLVAIGLMLGSARLAAIKGNEGTDTSKLAAPPQQSSNRTIPGGESSLLFPRPPRQPGDATREP